MNIKQTIKKELQQRSHWYFYVRGRNSFSQNDLKGKEPNIKQKLDSNDIVKINALWDRKLNKKGYRWFELYKTIWPSSELKYFVPDDFYYKFIDEFFAKRKECKIIDDKNLYDLLLHDVAQPKTIARSIDGVLTTSAFNPISHGQFIELCNAEGRVIIKQSVDSEGGKGVVFYDSEKEGNEKLFFCLKLKNFVVQKVIQQHSELAKLHPQSINTVRIMTLFFENKVHVLSTVVRMGVGDSKVDNASSGGIVCGVNDDGSLKNRAFDVKANQYDVHPSGVHFESVTVPNFEECKSLCIKLATRFIQFSRLISWDFAIGTDGHPILIEANLSYGQIDFHQMCNGPIFGQMSEKVLKYVFDNNPLIKYK